MYSRHCRITCRLHIFPMLHGLRYMKMLLMAVIDIEGHAVRFDSSSVLYPPLAKFLQEVCRVSRDKMVRDIKEKSDRNRCLSVRCSLY